MRSARPPAGAQQRADLAAQEAGAIEPEPDRAPAECGILLDHRFHIGQCLVAADVEGAEGHGLGACGIQHRAIERELVAGARQALADHELQLGAEQADACAAGVLDMRQVDGEPCVDHQLDLLAVLGDARKIAQGQVLRLAAGTKAHALGEGGLDLLRRADIDRARRAVDDDGVAGIGDAGRVRDFADGGNAERAGHDRDVGIGGAFLQHDAAQALAVVVEQRRWAHRARDDDGVVGQLFT